MGTYVELSASEMTQTDYFDFVSWWLLVCISKCAFENKLIVSKDYDLTHRGPMQHFCNPIM